MEQSKYIKASVLGKVIIKRKAIEYLGHTLRSDGMLDLLRKKISEKEVTDADFKRFVEAKENIKKEKFILLCEFFKEDWREIYTPNALEFESKFFGRKQELKELQKQITNTNCQLFILYGLEGIGKKSLAGQLVKKIERASDTSRKFKVLVNLSFSYDFPLDVLLIKLLREIDSPNSYDNSNIDDLKDKLFLCLQNENYLIILKQVADNGNNENPKEYEKFFGELINPHNHKFHNSCILLITHKKPHEVTGVAGVPGSAQSLKLEGLKEQPALDFLEYLNPNLLVDRNAAEELVKRYDGYPLALKLINSEIVKYYSGSVRIFLDKSKGEENLLVPHKIKQLILKLTVDLDLACLEILKILIDSEPISQWHIEKEFLKNGVFSNRDFTRAIGDLDRRALLTQYKNDRDYLYGVGKLTREVIRDVVNAKL